jgi:hypothetical protein
VLEFCCAARIDFLAGVTTATTLRRHSAALEASTARRPTSAPIWWKLRRYKKSHQGAATQSRVGRIIARIEADP